MHTGITKAANSYRAAKKCLFFLLVHFHKFVFPRFEINFKAALPHKSGVMMKTEQECKVKKNR